MNFAMNLTPLVGDDGIDPAEYVQQHVDRLAADIRQRIVKFDA